MAQDSKCVKLTLVLFSGVHWLTGACVFIFGLWMWLDPRKSYLLALVNTADFHIGGVTVAASPLLRFATYLLIAAGAASLAAGFLGCISAVREAPCALTGFAGILAAIFASELSAAVLAVAYRQALHLSLPTRFDKMVRIEYGRLDWVTRVVDQVQYFESCCGAQNASDWNESDYVIRYSQGSLLKVPPSCCTQRDTSWYTNLQPIDSEACFYKPATSARFTDGCTLLVLRSLDRYSLAYILVGLCVGLFQVLGIALACGLCRRMTKPQEHYL